MADFQRAIETLGAFGPVLAVKLYRVTLDRPPAVPILPCLDHEAMLHQNVPPHAAAYVQEQVSGGLHEVVFIPRNRRIEVDTVSTFGAHTDESHLRLLALLAAQFPHDRIAVRGFSRWRGDRRVVGACRAQVSLADVLLGHDIAGVVTYQVLGLFTARLGEPGVATLRYVVVSVLGAVFLYYGLKAVQLTEMSNRVWKRAAEYGLILAERRRLRGSGPG